MQDTKITELMGTYPVFEPIERNKVDASILFFLFDFTLQKRVLYSKVGSCSLIEQKMKSIPSDEWYRPFSKQADCESAHNE